ncbi:MAG: S8 family serine peptidase [Synergistaceae bacterium]|nr:S8 family serine peptidase [Synergistaceae bacterium]
MKKVFAALILILSFAGAAFADKTVPGDVIVMFKNNSGVKVSAAEFKASHLDYVNQAASDLGAGVKQVFSALSEADNSLFAVLHSDSKDENELLKEVLARPDVAGAGLNHVFKPMSNAAPTDKYYDALWGMKAINADKLWAQGYTGSDKVYAAVIDTGIDSQHEDLKANIASQYCGGFVVTNFETGESKFSNDAADYQDPVNEGHGTHVAGIISAVGDNNIGVAGVNWNAKVIALKAYVEFNGVGGFPDDLIIGCLDRVLQLKNQGVNIAVVNMSLGGFEDGTPEEKSQPANPAWNAMKKVSDAGIIICVSAGNDNSRVGYAAPYDGEGDSFKQGQYTYPASYLNIDNMIVVAAACMSGDMILRSSGNSIFMQANSNYGDKVDIAAPGEQIASTTPTNFKPQDHGDEDFNKLMWMIESVEEGVVNYRKFAGTSMAAPHVTGAAVLLKSIYPEASAAQIKRAILEGANKNYCANDAETEIYYCVFGVYDSKLIHDVTSKHGLLDVEGALDKLTEIIESESDSEAVSSHGSSSSSGCSALNAGLLILLSLSAVMFKKR